MRDARAPDVHRRHVLCALERVRRVACALVRELGDALRLLRCVSTLLIFDRFGLLALLCQSRAQPREPPEQLRVATFSVWEEQIACSCALPLQVQSI